MKKVLIAIGVMGIVGVLSGCAVFSDNSRPSLLGGDADLSLIATRNSKTVSKNDGANSNQVKASSIAEPTGGENFTLDPATLGGLLKALNTVEANRTVQAPVVQAPVIVETPVCKVIKTPVVYTVKKGDCLSTIAKKNGTTVKALKKTNGLKSDKLDVGDVLRIP